MRLIVGLGNPGSAYARNRHNIGYMTADEIVRCHQLSAWRAKFHGFVADGAIGGSRVLVLKPDTYMNRSGEAVLAAASFHKIDSGDVIVLHDDLDLPPGKIRIKRGGGSGGHNGLKSIDAHFGPDYWRVRLGIGHPGHRDAVTPWVLGDFAAADATWLSAELGSVARHLPDLLSDHVEKFMAAVAGDLPRHDAPEGVD